jgi:hypothetical protein
VSRTDSGISTLSNLRVPGSPLANLKVYENLQYGPDGVQARYATGFPAICHLPLTRFSPRPVISAKR